jgi:eukaryotic-like serine/threonine-protein kinase
VRELERFLEREVRGFVAVENALLMSPFRRREAETLVEEAPPVVEEEELAPPPTPPPAPPRPLLWPWLLLLLVLVLGGLLAAWLLTRDDSGTSTSTVNVPSVVQLKQPEAVARLNQRGLMARMLTRASSAAAGTVIAQDPDSGADVTRGSAVRLTVSRGPVTVPNTIGQSRDTAVAAVRSAGLKPKVFAVPSSHPKGTVIAQRPRPGGHLPGESTVRLNISNGAGSGAAPPPPPPPAPPTSVTVPDVTGQQQDDAQRQLNAAGLKAGVVYLKSEEPQGTVVSQAPAGGATRAGGTRIQLNVALGSQPGTLKGVPDVRNLDPADARAKLTAAGFTVQTLRQPVSDRSQVGKVVDEQPRGRNAPLHSVVTIYVGRSA